MPCTPTSWAHQQVSQRGGRSVFTDTSPPDPGLPAPISGSPPTSGSQGEDWEARPRNATPHEGPRLHSDPVLSHPTTWEEGWRAVVTMFVLLPPPHPAGPEETSSPLLNGRAPRVPSFCPLGFGTGNLGASDRGLAPSTWPRLSQHLLCGHLLFGRPLLGPVCTRRPQVLEHRPFLLLS